jgi:hypothetical protein
MITKPIDIHEFNEDYFRVSVSWHGIELKMNKRQTIGILDKETYSLLEEMCLHIISSTWVYYQPSIWEKYPEFEALRECTGLAEPKEIHADPPKPAIFFYDDFAYVVMPVVTEEDEIIIDKIKKLIIAIEKIKMRGIEQYKKEMGIE